MLRLNFRLFYVIIFISFIVNDSYCQDSDIISFLKTHQINVVIPGYSEFIYEQNQAYKKSLTKEELEKRQVEVQNYLQYKKDPNDSLLVAINGPQYSRLFKVITKSFAKKYKYPFSINCHECSEVKMKFLISYDSGSIVITPALFDKDGSMIQLDGVIDKKFRRFFYFTGNPERYEIVAPMHMHIEIKKYSKNFKKFLEYLSSAT